MADGEKDIYTRRFLTLCELMKKEREENHLNYPVRPKGMYIGGIRHEPGDVIITDWNTLKPRIIKPFT